MKKPTVFRPKLTQIGSLANEQDKPCHLKLVVSNPLPPQAKPRYQMNPNAGFTIDIQKRDPFNYVLVACDPFHCLDCEILIKIHEDEEELEPMSVVCHFPNILDADLIEYVDGDETLYSMILIQFKMKLLKKILLFCADHNALNLLIYTDDTPEGHALEIYRHVAKYEAKIPTTTGKKAQLAIPITPKTFDLWFKFADRVNQNFRQTLWKNQSSNPAIREYLKSNLYMTTRTHF